MPFLSWRVALFVFVMLPTLAGCTGNYTFDDADYRPLGNPYAMRSGQ